MQENMGIYVMQYRSVYLVVHWCGMLNNPKNNTTQPIQHSHYAACMQGKILLSKIPNPPETLTALFHNQNAKSKHYLENIRSFNMMFSFTSMRGRINRSVNVGNGLSIYIMCGENYHMILSLLPPQGSTPKFGQLYIYDTEHEISNRMHVVRYIPFHFWHLYVLKFHQHFYYVYFFWLFFVQDEFWLKLTACWDFCWLKKKC